MDLKQLAIKFNDTFNDRSYRTKAGEYVSPNVVGKDIPSGQEFHGPDAFVQYSEGFVKAMPDIKGTIISTEVNDHKVTTRIRGQGTFTGQMMLPQGIVPGTGKKLDLEYTGEFEFDDTGKLTRYAYNYDMNEFMRQLGLG